jgi:hypothetical protein
MELNRKQIRTQFTTNSSRLFWNYFSSTWTICVCVDVRDPGNLMRLNRYVGFHQISSKARLSRGEFGNVAANKLGLELVTMGGWPP